MTVDERTKEIPMKDRVSSLDAIEYELQRDSEPDCRDDDGPEVEEILARLGAS